jgi:hypothetical protein
MSGAATARARDRHRHDDRGARLAQVVDAADKSLEVLDVARDHLEHVRVLPRHVEALEHFALALEQLQQPRLVGLQGVDADQRRDV